MRSTNRDVSAWAFGAEEREAYQQTQAKPSRALSCPQYTNVCCVLIKIRSQSMGARSAAKRAREEGAATYLQLSPPPRLAVMAAAPAVQNNHVKNKLSQHRVSTHSTANLME